MLRKMEEIQLTETEQRYFGDLFVCCDSDNSGKIPVCKASELFRTANLPLDVVKQITELSGGGAASHFGRQQFYLALKLIAAFQAGLPLQPEIFHSSFDVPLPRFTWAATQDKWEPQHINRQQVSPDLIQLSDTDQALTPQCEPITVSPNDEGEVELRTELHTNEGSFTPSSGPGPGPDPDPGPKGTSPEASSTASDSPTPTNSVQERNWAVTTHWHGLVCEEQRQLLGTEEESSDRHSSDEEGDTDGDVWTITEEQREYYSAQFRSLQPDPSGLIAGPVARLFFEKSRLPVQELRKIWQLADVTKDGALSLDEFNTAMHLVVLRRNNIDLPDSLPPSLVPPHQCQPATVVPVEPSAKEGSPPSISPSTGEPSSPPRSKEWTKFVDSPTSSVSSPGPKPVNFDFHKSAVEQDPKILHPVPLRLTPESQCLPPAEEEACRSPRKLNEAQQIPYEQLSTEGGSPKKGAAVPPLAVAENNVPTASEIRPIQRPQPKKHAAPGPGAIPPPPQPGTLTTPDEVPVSLTASTTASTQSGPTSLPMPVTQQMGPKKEPPPPPPPRPYRTHARSSSLDLNRLGKSGSLLGAPPVVPPRVSPSTTSPKKLNGQRSEGDVLALAGEGASFADFAQFGQDEENCRDSSQPRRHGAFEVYRKPSNRTGALDVSANAQQLDSPEKDPQPHKHPVTNTTRCSDSLHQLQEQNSLLIRVCQELNQELAEVQEERASLELKLEQLREHMAD